MLSALHDQEVDPPQPTKLVGEVDALRLQAREQIEAVRETMEELDALRTRIEDSR